MTDEAGRISDAVLELLRSIGEDPSREGLRQTPRRVESSFQQLYGGYNQDPADVLKTFKDDACDEMVILTGCEFYSTCLLGSTFVDTPRGRIPINRLEDGEFVYCWDEDRLSMTIARAVNPRITGTQKRLWRVFTDKDTVLCTGNHKFMTCNRGWTSARNLNEGDSIVSLNRGTIVEGGGVPRSYIVWSGKKKQIPEHRFIYEEINGDVEGKHIHHINRRQNDNRPENLTALSPSDHLRLHRLEDGPTGFALFTDEQRLAMKKKQIEGIKASQVEEVRKKRSESLKKYWSSLSPEERAKRNHRVLLVEKTQWRDDVWCMEVPGYENFVANGMVVHNCEHHMLPFFGTAHIAYIPDGRVIGISKLARILEIYSRRLQVQERLTEQITEALDDHLKPKGSACVLKASHMCMMSRGVQKQNSKMITSSLTGVFREKPEVRQEFMSMIRNGG